MADTKASGFPWGSIAVLLTFVASTQLVPKAFDQLRPSEKERVQPSAGADLVVDARLWEDPFVAVRRFEAERLERCKAVAKDPAQPAECVADELHQQRAPARLMERLDKDADGDREETLVIATMVPGNPFVGAEEGRRRMRYALLAGLQSKEYVPDNPERIGLLQFDLPPGSTAATAAVVAAAAPAASASGAATALPPRLLVPYELLSERPLLRGEDPKAKASRYAQVALLWIDEAALPAPKFDALARSIAMLFASTGGCPPHLALLGPSSTDGLRLALSDLKQASLRPLPPAGPNAAAPGPACKSGRLPRPDLDLTRQGYAHVAHAEIVNTAATAPNYQLEELNGQRLESFLDERFAAVIGQREPLDVNYRRTIGLDNEVLRSLVKELELRFPPNARRRVVLVAERDSLYSQALVSELRYRMRGTTTLDFEVVYFYRGLDGATVREGADKAAPPKGGSGEAAIEWPESRDQLDYLRRMADALKQSEASSAGPIGAIGILGNDVHDKLLVLQALHDKFSDKVFFTTDMDARYLHPRARAFTRNLIVASSLPLAFPRTVARDDGGPARPGEAQMVLQAGTPPLRDVYQSSAFLAARRVGTRDEAGKVIEGRLADWALKNPSIYEIGRSRALPLAGYAHDFEPKARTDTRVVVAAAMGALLVGGLLVWPSTPALRTAGARLLRVTATGQAPPLRLACAALVALHFALLSFTIASLIEFAEPGQLDFIAILLLASLSALVALIALYPRYPRYGASGTAVGEPARRRNLTPVRLMIIAAATLGWVWVAWPAPQAPQCMRCEPMFWVEGVSAWPSHLLHLLALIAIACALDYSWSITLRSMSDDSRWLRITPPPPGKLPSTAPRRGATVWLARNSVAAWRDRRGGGQGWRDEGVDFRRLWRQYVRLGGSSPRALRTLFWYAITVAVVAVLFFQFSEGRIPEVPVRGAEHRQLVAWTLYATLLLLPLLVVAVADATVLVVRFMGHLNAGRTLYPAETVQAFAQTLGTEHAALWIEPIAADPADRPPAGASAPPVAPAGVRPWHTLLDNWIDVQVVARRTRVVAPLVIGPFVVLALLIVARSRLFDNWSLTLPIALAASAYLMWLMLLASLLKRAAERTRRCALERMNADLRWLAGSGRDKLVEPFKRLIAAVESNQTGAFAPFFEQPLFKALLVPLGGAGGAQLFDYLLLGH